MSRSAFRTTLAAALTTLALGFASAASADLTIVSNVTAQGHSQTTTQYITAGKVRSSDGQVDTIMDIAAGKMTMIDHKKKSYSEVTLAEMHEKFAEIEKTLAGNPMLEKMMGAVNEVTVDKTGEKREIAGYSCQKYVLSMGDKFRFELWATPELKVPMQYYDARKMAYAAMGPMAARFDKIYEEMKKIDGVSLATTTHVGLMGMNIETVMEATSVSTDAVPDSAFAVPAGYKQAKSPFK